MKKRQSNKAKRFVQGCENNGTCNYCRSSRLHQANREAAKADSKLKEVRDENY